MLKKFLGCIVIIDMPTYFPEWRYHFALLTGSVGVIHISTALPAFGLAPILAILLGVQG